MFSPDEMEDKAYQKIMGQRKASEVLEDIDRNLKSMVRLIDQRNKERNQHDHLEDKSSIALSQCIENLHTNWDSLKRHFKRVRKDDRKNEP